MVDARGSTTLRAEPWSDADRLFRSDPRWLGSDDAYSVPLGDEKTLWLFGDTFVDGSSRRDARFIRNSVGIQRGSDPTRATIGFTWDRAPDGSFFEAPPGTWYWPLHGARVGERLLLFMMQVRSPAGGSGAIDEWRELGALGFFDVFGWAAIRVENPDDEPRAWRTMRVAERTESIVLGASALVEDDHLVVFGWDERKRLSLARWPLGEIDRDDLGEPERWNGSAWGTAAEPVIEHGATEFSVHRARDGAVQVQMSPPHQALTIRRAPALIGPWTDPEIVFRPEETHRDGVFVYAGKAHPHLGDDVLVCTYASNADVDTCLDDDSIYFPRFVRVEGA
ncbi:MAG: DUF4185 domain-containing protein [Actinomycetota bacterium]